MVYPFCLSVKAPKSWASVVLVNTLGIKKYVRTYIPQLVHAHMAIVHVHMAITLHML